MSTTVTKSLSNTHPTAELSARYRIVLISPQGYQHAGALAELAETLIYGLDGLGVSYQFSMNNLGSCETNIILGAHLLSPKEMEQLPTGSIIYNTEQIDGKSSWISPSYLALLKRQTVWDYSKANIDALKKLGIAPPTYVPIGYVPQLTRIPTNTEQDIDVLFYGAINERRRAILEGLIARGLRIEFLSGVYREERDHYIARSKVILNMHYYDASVFEIVRVSYLLANEKAIVAECGDHTTLEPDIRNAVRAVAYDQLVDACAALVADINCCATLAHHGLEIFSKRDEKAILAKTLGFESAECGTDFPKLLNLGSGKDWRENCLNVDICETVRPDALFDIGQPLSRNHHLTTMRFGTVTLRDNTFDAIFANDVLEHLPDLLTAMSNCLRLLKAGGTFHIYVPYDLSLGAWQDPTHVRAFNENSWLYYTDWYWYMGWTEARFEQLSLDFRLSDIGNQLRDEGALLKDLLRMPRAVDGMSVILRKRYLLESEAARVGAAMHRPWDGTTGNVAQ